MKLTTKRGRLLSLLLALALIAAACGSDGGDTSSTADGGDDTPAESSDSSDSSDSDGGTEEAAGSTDPVVVCELAYYTGDFAELGETLTNDVKFPIEQVINADPPLGREWQHVGADLGTVGEAQAARECLEVHGAEVMVSIAHGYATYRDFMIEYWEENDSPIVPSVHGGAIPGNIGGQPDEPIFRAQGLDAGLGTAAIQYAESIGAENVVIFQTEVEGFVLASDAAEGAAAEVGIEVLDRIAAQPSQPSYRAQVETIADLNPDVVIVQANSTDAGALISQAADAGLSLNWIGETGMVQPEFIDALGVDNIDSQVGIGVAAFAPDETTEAWDFYSSTWDSTQDTDSFGTAGDLYHFSTYDVMVHTALAVVHAGSYSASAWAPSMNAVGSADGTECFTYQACKDLLDAGEEINYQGVTGSGEYTDGGVNDQTAAYTPITSDGSLGTPEFLDTQRSLELISAVAPVAECDSDNVCDW